jgi:hypothetical protein
MLKAWRIETNKDNFMLVNSTYRAINIFSVVIGSLSIRYRTKCCNLRKKVARSLGMTKQLESNKKKLGNSISKVMSPLKYLGFVRKMDSDTWWPMPQLSQLRDLVTRSPEEIKKLYRIFVDAPVDLDQKIYDPSIQLQLQVMGFKVDELIANFKLGPIISKKKKTVGIATTKKTIRTVVAKKKIPCQVMQSNLGIVYCRNETQKRIEDGQLNSSDLSNEILIDLYKNCLD